ncbi:MAG: hypothetical protein Q8P44_02355, partial [Dehalococcoidia bacterium]|nr:hypothetical protein [Dehalococcoidia bacterium]
TEAYSQMRLTAEAASSVFADNLWTEPAVFNNYGKTIFTILHNTTYLWIVRQNRILIAPTDSNMQDVSANLQNIEAITTPRDGSVAVELRNDTKQYNSPILGIGAQLEVEWGYQTPSGVLYTSVSTYWVERLEYRREAYKSTMVFHALDAWGVLKKLRARYQYVWAAGAASIEDILKWLLARAGFSYTTVSASPSITGQTPPFTLYANETYANAIIRLLQKVPDVIYFRAATARAVNPASGDASVYAYGGAHAILEGRYITEALGVNSVIVIGDAITTYDWEVTEAAASGERVFQVYDKSLTTAALAHQRGAAEESRAARERASGIVTVPLQPAQELYDVIDVTDSLLGLSASRRRVAGLKHRYNTRKGEYSLTMQLSNVFYTFAP